MDRQAFQRGVGTEPAGRAHEVRQRLPRLQLVDRRPEHGARDLGTFAVQRYVDDVARFEADVVPLVAAQQVVVEIERGYGLVEPPDLDVPHVGALRDPAGGIQGGQRRAEGADLIGAGLPHLADHVHLVHAHVGNRNVEPDRRLRSAQHLRGEDGDCEDNEGEP